MDVNLFSSLADLLTRLFGIFFLLLGEFDHAINLSRPKLIFASAAVARRAIKIAEKNAFVQKIILFETIDQNGKQIANKLTTSYNDLMKTVKVRYFCYCGFFFAICFEISEIYK